MKNLNTFSPVINAAAEYSNVAVEDMLYLNINFDGNLFEVEFESEYMNYIMYIDYDGTVFGFMSTPIDEHRTNTVDILEALLCA